MSMSKPSNTASVFFRNLDPRIDKQVLHQICSTFGEICRCDVVRNKAGQPKGYAFVHYQNSDSANQCIAALNGMVLLDKQISAEPVMAREERQRAALLCNVYVKNFGNELNNDTLKEMFSKYGSITKHRVVTNKNGKSHGFVVFTNPASAEKAIQELNGKKLKNGMFLQVESTLKTAPTGMGSEMRVAQINSYDDPGVNLYVSNLDKSINIDDLRNKFAAFGTIKSLKIMYKAGHSEGYGFVRYVSVEEAIKAISEMNGQKFEGSNKSLHVSLATCRADRQAATQCLQYIARMIIMNSAVQLLQPGEGFLDTAIYSLISSAEEFVYWFNPNCSRFGGGNRSRK
ncbi:polyadenylate-binding protein 1-A-like [Malaya genurostris]|uniref:polyadenylate-binding protein 1-A-like n=1 Tax=Malaya genurostris TaxID=325434 RepID=UPI0026F3BCE8|nr:polyadenylate-binding protein 1-A-like [Malaya genurostris]